MTDLTTLREAYESELPPSEVTVSSVTQGGRRRRRAGVAAGVAGAAAVALAVVAGVGVLGRPEAAVTPATPDGPLVGCLDDPASCRSVIEERGRDIGWSSREVEVTTGDGTTTLGTSVAVPGVDAPAISVVVGGQVRENLTGASLTLLDGTVVRSSVAEELDQRMGGIWVVPATTGRPPVILEIGVFPFDTPLEVTTDEIRWFLDGLVSEGEESPGTGCTLVLASCDTQAIAEWFGGQDRGEGFRQLRHNPVGDYTSEPPVDLYEWVTGSSGRGVNLWVGPVDDWPEGEAGASGQTFTVAGVTVRSVDGRHWYSWVVDPEPGRHAGIRLHGPDPIDEDRARELFRVLLQD